MSLASAALDFLKAWLPSGSVSIPVGSTIEATIAGHGITFGEMQQAVALLKGINPLLPKIEALLKGYGSDVKQDLLITDQIIELLAQEAASLGIPYAGLVATGAYGVGFLLQILPNIQLMAGVPDNIGLSEHGRARPVP
jgi:hypothetical protein